MGLPKTLKNMMLFNEGQNYLGEAKSVTLPTLTRKMEEWRAAGMSGAVKMDMGMDGTMEVEATFGGPMRGILRQWGTPTLDGIYWRFAGAYQADDAAPIDRVEIIVRGRYEEIEMGDQEVGELGEFKAKMAVAYYKLVWNGRTEIEIDPMSMIEMVDGIDRLADQRDTIGIF